LQDILGMSAGLTLVSVDGHGGGSDRGCKAFNYRLRVRYQDPSMSRTVPVAPSHACTLLAFSWCRPACGAPHGCS
jgi:hypothetical protein